jgi:cation transport protein ChaC
LVLALDEGGSCEGVAYHIPENRLDSELELLWRREMVSGNYVPTWVPAHTRSGEVFAQAIAFVMNRESEVYAPLSEPEVVRRLATAAGELGSCADYLFRTRNGLREIGASDAEIDRLAQKVEEFIAVGLRPLD